MRIELAFLEAQRSGWMASFARSVPNRSHLDRYLAEFAAVVAEARAK